MELDQSKQLSNLAEKIKAMPEMRFAWELIEKFPDSRVVLVGGIVRDAILARESRDYDFLVEGIAPDDLQKVLTTHGKLTEVESLNFGIFKFRPENSELQIDIGLPRLDRAGFGKRAHDIKVKIGKVTVEEDFSRRDFTINAMGLDLKTGTLIDSYQGMTDLDNKLIKAVGEPRLRFNEDPARILRAIRFACQLDFQIEDKTWQAAKKGVKEVTKQVINGSGKAVTRVSWEKIGEELAKSLLANPRKAGTLPMS